MKYKSCNRCSLDKPLSAFGKHPQGKEGLLGQCKDCRKTLRKLQRSSPEAKLKTKQYNASIKDKRQEYYKTWNKNPKRKHWMKIYNRKVKLQKTYGLTIEDFDRMKAQQDNRCEICKTEFNEDLKFVHVDHCHVTGKIRSLLCNYCNVGLGHFFDNEQFLTNSIEYLRKHK